MDSTIYNEVIAASKANDIQKVKKGLAKLNLIKAFNPIKDIYYYFKQINKTEFDKYYLNYENKELINKLFINAIGHNNFDFCDYLISSKDLNFKVDLNSGGLWSKTVEIGNVESVKYLLKVNKSENGAELLTKALQYGSSSSNVETLKYLIDDPNMPFHKEVNRILKLESEYHTRAKNFNIPNISQCFISSCQYGNKEWADYLLQHKEYGPMIDSFSFLEGIKKACHPKTFEMMVYLLTDKNMPFKSYQDYDPQRLLQITTRHNFDDILNYLVMDFNIKKPDRFFSIFDVGVISQHVVSFKDQNEIDAFNEKIGRLNDLFEKRDLHNELQANLKHNNPSNKTIRKI